MDDDLILRGLDGDLPGPELEALARWRAADPAHERRYRQLERLSAVLAEQERGSVPARPDPGSLIRRSRVRSRPSGSERRWLFGLAAAAVIGVVGFGVLEIYLGSTRNRDSIVRDLMTGPGEASTVQLADGSVVRLAPDSRLSFRADQRREVWLDGTAYFAVAKQEGRPFVVRTRAGSTTVLGTRFELQATADRLRVVVVEGRVAVENEGKRIEVDGGEMTFVGSGVDPVVNKVSEPSELVGWVGKVLLFRDTPLERAVSEIERTYPIEIQIDDSILRRHLVTATFPEQPVEQVVNTVCRILDADCVMHRDTVRVRRRR
ncbi:MAG: FecR domain-containing protein [Gemmatimonadetes bacterium]|nr:FecR domain-containing protein [Gemmatimonadota bacterium]MCC7134090.1 FecR domain-containing protein [Gemmatimonadales bacterium]